VIVAPTKRELLLLAGGGFVSNNTHATNLVAASTQYWSTPDDPDNSITADMTQRAMVRFTSLPISGSGMAAISKYDAQVGVDQRSWQLLLRNIGGTQHIDIILASTGSGVFDFVRYTWTPSANIWYRLEFTVDISAALPGEISLWIDAVDQGDGTIIQDNSITALHDSTTALRAGTSLDGAGNPSNKFNGDIDDWTGFSDVRTDGEIAAGELTELDPSVEDNMAWYYKFNNDGVDSANGHTASPINSPTFTTDVAFT